MSEYKNVVELAKGDRFVYDHRKYAVNAVAVDHSRAFVETTTGTLLSFAVDEAVEVY